MSYHMTLKGMNAFDKTVRIKDFGIALEKSSETVQKIVEVMHFDKLSRPNSKTSVSDYVKHSVYGPILGGKVVKLGVLEDGSMGFIGNKGSKSLFNSRDLTIKTGIHVNKAIQQLDIFQKRLIETIDAMEKEAKAVNELQHVVQNVINKINELADIKDAETRFHESNVNHFKIGYVDKLGLVFEVEESFILDKKTLLYKTIWSDTPFNNQHKYEDIVGENGIRYRNANKSVLNSDFQELVPGSQGYVAHFNAVSREVFSMMSNQPLMKSAKSRFSADAPEQWDTIMVRLRADVVKYRDNIKNIEYSWMFETGMQADKRLRHITATFRDSKADLIKSVEQVLGDYKPYYSTIKDKIYKGMSSFSSHGY